jgi:hypothetical protein
MANFARGWMASVKFARSNDVDVKTLVMDKNIIKVSMKK